MKALLPAAALCAGALSVPALAQEAGAAPAPPDTPVAPLVITATLTPTPLDRVGSSISLIDAADIAAHQWRTLPDALAASPGLSLFQTGGPGGQTSVFIRGANSNHTKVLIDGIEVNDPSQNDAFDFGQLLTAGVDRVEVLRGPQSSLYGSDALGGVVNVITRGGAGPARFDAGVEGGSFSTLNQSAALAGGSDRGSFALNLSHLHSGDTPVTPLGLLAPGERRIGDAYDNTTVSSRATANLGPGAGVDLAVRYTRSQLANTGEDFAVFPAIPDSAQTVQDDRQIFARVQGRLDLLGGRLQNVLGLAYTGYDSTIQAPNDGFGLPAPVRDKSQRFKAGGLGTLNLGRGQTLVIGLGDDIERLIDSPIDARDADQGAFVEWQSRLGRSLTLAASVRWDHDDSFGTATTWRLAPTWTVAATGTQLKASVGTGFKAPTLTQLYVSFPTFGFFANPDLKPETSTGYDVGFEQPLAAGRLRLGATWFHNAIRNLIETDATGATWANIGRATTYGVESFVAVQPARAVTLRADYTWTIAKDDTTDEELIRRPKNKASLTADWRASRRLNLAASLLYVSSWVDGNRAFSVRRLQASPYSTADIAASYALGGGVTLFGRIDNLLDRRYQEPVGFQRPGLGAFAGVKVDFGSGSRGF